MTLIRSTTTTPSGRAPVLSASSIAGTQVLDAKRDHLGSIDDLMLDADTGGVSYAVLCIGGFLGMGDRLFAIPWKALTVDPADHSFVLDVDHVTLEQAPDYNQIDWPTPADSTWMHALYRHYGFAYPSSQRL